MLPFRFLWFTSAPASMRKRTTSAKAPVGREHHRRIAEVLTASTFAPCATSELTTSLCPCFAAMDKTVRPPLYLLRVLALCRAGPPLHQVSVLDRVPERGAPLVVRIVYSSAALYKCLQDICHAVSCRPHKRAPGISPNGVRVGPGVYQDTRRLTMSRRLSAYKRRDLIFAERVRDGAGFYQAALGPLS